jgi:S-adenosylmethionine-diacylgycerolhomoserine-N-methlytransferase
MSATSSTQLMNDIYSWQTDIYDLTRKYYLLGRDELIDELNAEPHHTILEIGCGTARNLIRASRLYPRSPCYGIDVSTIMLAKAHESIEHHGLSERISLAHADACASDFSPVHFPQKYDRIYFSYTLSMIPNWRAALRNALARLEDNGTLMLIDFGGLDQMPTVFKSILYKWLALFSVHPQSELESYVHSIAESMNMSVHISKPYAGYAIKALITKQSS